MGDIPLLPARAPNCNDFGEVEAMSSTKVGESKPPHLWFRLLALAFTPFYLFLWSVALHEITELPLAATLPAIFLGAFLVMAVLVAFGLKALQGTERIWRFNISSIMLVMVPLGAYLSFLRLLFKPVPFENLDWAGWLSVAVGSITFMVVTTIVLLAFAEALAWLGVKAVRLANAPNGGAPSEPAQDVAPGDDLPNRESV